MVEAELLSGELYVIEGPDAVGKTTIAKTLTNRLAEDDIPTEYVNFPGTQPDSIGSLIRDLLEDSGATGLSLQDVTPTSIQLLHIAAHVNQIEKVIHPHLSDGTTVVLDRYWWSTAIYGMVQGVPKRALEMMIEVEKEIWGNITPSYLFLIDRTEPLESVSSRTDWATIKECYNDVVTEKDRLRSIARVENNRSVDDTVAEILTYIR